MDGYYNPYNLQPVVTPANVRRGKRRAEAAEERDPHAYGRWKGYLNSLDWLIHTYPMLSGPYRNARSLYNTLVKEKDVDEKEVWGSYEKNVKAHHRKLPRESQFRRRQAIGYAEIHGPNANAFLLVWNYSRAINTAQWVCVEDMESDEMSNELNNHFISEALDFAQGSPVVHFKHSPRIVLLPGLESIRDMMREDLEGLLKEKGWAAQFDDDNNNRQGYQVKAPWGVYEDLKAFKDLPEYHAEAGYDITRDLLNKLFHEITPLTYANDDVEDGPIMVARAIQIMPGDSPNLVWWYCLDSHQTHHEEGIWFVEGEKDLKMLDENFFTDALLRYGCTTDPFPSRNVAEHSKHRSLTLLSSLEVFREDIAHTLALAIAHRDEFMANKAETEADKKRKRDDDPAQKTSQKRKTKQKTTTKSPNATGSKGRNGKAKDPQPDHRPLYHNVFGEKWKVLCLEDDEYADSHTWCDCGFCGPPYW